MQSLDEPLCFEISSLREHISNSTCLATAVVPLKGHSIFCSQGHNGRRRQEDGDLEEKKRQEAMARLGSCSASAKVPIAGRETVLRQSSEKSPLRGSLTKEELHRVELMAVSAM